MQTSARKPFFSNLPHAWILLGIIVVFAAVVRFYQLDAHPLWIDEVFTGVIADPENSFLEVLDWAYSEPYTMAPLIFVAENFLMKALGENAIALRLFGVLTGVLSIVLIYKLGELWFGKQVGLISAVLLAVSPLHIFHSREARYYAPIILFSIAAYYFHSRALETNDRKMWLGFVLASLANLYTHLSALILLGVQILFTLFLSFADKNIFREEGFSLKDVRNSYFGAFLASLGIISVLFLPSVFPIYNWISAGNLFGNQGETIGLDFGPGFVLEIFSNFGAGDGVALSLFFGVFLVGWFYSYKQHKQVFTLFLFCFVVPFVVIGFLRPQHWFSSKYVIFLLPLSLIAASLGIEYLSGQLHQLVSRWYSNKISPTVILSLFTTLFVYFGLSTLSVVYSTKLDNWQDYADLIANNVQPEDAIAITPQTIGIIETNLVLEYLLPPEFDSRLILVNHPSELDALANSHHRVWFVRHRLPTSAELEAIDSWTANQPAVSFAFEEGDTIYYIGSNISIDALLEEVSEFQITHPEMYASIGDAFVAQAMWAESIVPYQRAASVAPDEGIYHYYLATSLYQIGDYESAEAEYLKAIQVDPLVPGFHAALADLLLETSRPQEAKLHYEEAIQLWVSENYHDEGGYLDKWQQAIEEIDLLIVD